MYRIFTLLWLLDYIRCFGGQDTQLLLWDLEMDEIVVPLRRPPGGSPTFSAGSQSSHWDSVVPVGTLQPAPSVRDVPKISPLVAHRVHNEPLSGVIFTQESVLTACREGHIKIWMRPGAQSSNAETLLSSSLKEKPTLSSKVGNSSYKQWLDVANLKGILAPVFLFLFLIWLFMFWSDWFHKLRCLY